MKHIVHIVILLVLATCVGCAWLSPKRESPVKTSGFIKVEKVINVDQLKEGGNLLIVPFRAGAGVEANEELDRIALMFVKGITDELKDNRPYFKILLADEADKAQVVIRGHVIELKRGSNFKKWFGGQRKISLTVKGKMINERTGEAILIFTDKRDTENKDETHSHLGYLIGQGIGRFIVSQSQ